jgi:hypothetical protein
VSQSICFAELLPSSTSVFFLVDLAAQLPLRAWMSPKTSYPKLELPAFSLSISRECHASIQQSLNVPAEPQAPAGRLSCRCSSVNYEDQAVKAFGSPSSSCAAAMAW